jgi:hypothetical protein
MFPFMGSQTNFLLKVLILSLGISVFIKYVGPSLPIPVTSLNALIAIASPTLILAIALSWRALKSQQPN